MSTIGVLAAALLLLAPAATADPLLEYVDNGSLEDFEDGAPVDWRVLAGTVGQTATAFDGNSAAVLTIPGDVLRSGIAQNISLDDDDLPTLSGTEYEFSFAAALKTGAGTPVTDPPTAEALVLWKDLAGQVVHVDHVEIAVSQAYVEHEVVLQSPIPEPGELPVTEAEIQFSIERASLTSRTDVNLFLDAVSFGPVLPTL